MITSFFVLQFNGKTSLHFYAAVTTANNLTDLETLGTRPAKHRAKTSSFIILVHSFS